MGEKINAYRLMVGKMKESARTEDIRVDGMIILKWILKK
jgi:hypothetical protein